MKLSRDKKKDLKNPKKDDLFQKKMQVLDIFQKMNKTLEAMNDVVKLNKENARILKNSVKRLKKNNENNENDVKLLENISDNYTQIKNNLFGTKSNLDSTLEKTSTLAREVSRKKLCPMSIPSLPN